MQIMLNKDKHGMLFLDGFPPLTFDEPGPLVVEVDELTTNQFNQINYNLSRGALVADNPDELLKFTQILEPAMIAPPKEEKVQKSITEIMSDQEEELVKLLAKTVSTIKKSVPALKGSELRKILMLEKDGKNRKSLIDFLDEANEINTKSVSSTVGEDSIDMEAHASLVKGGLGLNQYSKNVTDVVDSEVEEITIKNSK